MDESDDDDKVLGATKTDESITGQTDFEDMEVEDPVGLDSWNPFKGIAAPKGYSYVGKLSFICFGPSSKFFASTLAMGGQANQTLEEKKEGSRKAQHKITKERTNNDREV